MARGGFDDPALPGALRLLRHAARASQRDVVERVEAAGGALAYVYYRQIESGMRRPSAERLDAILAALGADRAALEQALAAVRSDGEPAPFRTPAGLPRPEAYRAAADAALAAGGWADPAVASPPAPAERELLDLFRALPDDARRALVAHARALAGGR